MSTEPQETEEPINYMDLAEFRSFGYLQEINRRFLHPLGLALEVVVHEDGTETLGGIWDYRDDPEGMCYGPEMLDLEKCRRVYDAEADRFEARRAGLGYWIQQR